MIYTDCVTWNDFNALLLFVIPVLLTQIINFWDRHRQYRKTQQALVMQLQRIQDNSEKIEHIECYK